MCVGSVPCDDATMFSIRHLNRASEGEIHTIVAFSLMTIWETVPELRADAGFTFQEMDKTVRAHLNEVDHQYRVAVNASGQVCGHTIYSVRHDGAGVLFGSCFTRYVLPTERRSGLASRFLVETLAWFQQRGARYAVAHAHVDNGALRALFERHGFTVADRLEGRWPTWVLRKEL